MNRREFAAGIVGIGAGTRSAAQDSGRAGAGAGRQTESDRLFRPDVVQERAAVTSADNDAEIQAVERRLKCTCGCNLDIYTCRTTDFTCTYSPELHREVLALRAAGKDSEGIVAAFVAKYGEQALMAPPPRGFNLAAYLVPGAALLAGGTVLAAMLLRRSRMREVALRAAPAMAHRPSPDAPSPEDLERVSRALADVED